MSAPEEAGREFLAGQWWTLFVSDRGDDYAGADYRFLAFARRPLEGNPWRKTTRVMGKPMPTQMLALDALREKVVRGTR